MKLKAIILFLVFFIGGCTVNMENKVVEQKVRISRDITNLQPAMNAQIIDVKDGSTIKLEAKPVVKEINGIKIKMYGEISSITP